MDGANSSGKLDFVPYDALDFLGGILPFELLRVQARYVGRYIGQVQVGRYMYVVSRLCGTVKGVTHLAPTQSRCQMVVLRSELNTPSDYGLIVRLVRLMHPGEGDCARPPPPLLFTFLPQCPVCT